MKRRERVWYALAVFVMGTLTVCAADSEAKLKARFAGRHEALVACKLEGIVGETAAGFVEVVAPKDADSASALKLVEAENRDRESLYELLAAEQETSTDYVGRQNAIFKFRKASPGERFKGKDGKWRTKKDMLSAGKRLPEPK